MLQKQKSRTSRHNISTKVKIIGYYANHIKQQQNQDSSPYQDTLHYALESESLKIKQTSFIPVHISTYNHAIALIDIQNKIWAILDISNEPICLSTLLKIKVYKVVLHYYEMMIKSKEGWLLLSWSNKRKLKEDKLQKIEIQNTKHKYYSYFQLFKIKDSSVHDLFQYSAYKQYFNEAEIYQISNNNHIITHPNKYITVLPKIAGISIGKYHNLIWTDEGKIYSWGLKSIALGYSYIPDQEIIEHPRQVDQMKDFVIKAYACVNYSLVVTLDGKVYQWGINKLYSQKQQTILEPQLVPVDTNNKVVNIKGNNEKYGLVTLQGQMFVWGKNMKQIIGYEKGTPIQWQKSLLYPTPINRNIGFVIDFQISQGFILLISSEKNIWQLSQSHEYYWKRMKQTIRQNLRQPFKLRQKENKNSCSANKIRISGAIKSRKGYNPIEQLLYKKQSKQQYIQNARHQKKVFQFIMNDYNGRDNSCSKERHQLQFSNSHQRHSQFTAKTSNLKTLRLNTQINDFNSTFQKQKQYIKLLTNLVCPAKDKTSILDINKLFKVNKLFQTKKKPKNHQSYNNKLQHMKKRKEEMESTFRQTTFKKVQNNSFEFRMIKKDQMEKKRKLQKEILTYKVSLQKWLIKEFLVKLINKPTVVGREAKISNFARNLKFQRIQRNIRSLFIKYGIKMRLKKLQTKQMYRFFLLTLCFQQYVKAFRAKKVKRNKQYIVNQIFKYLIKQKIKVGITTCSFNVKKLQKFKQWLTMVKIERIKCLKYVWKLNLLSTMSINPAHQSTTIIYLPKNIQELSFQAVYKERVIINPFLRLTNFLNKYSIFRIKANYFQKLISLFKSESQQKTKIIQIIQNKKARIKFYDDQDEKIDKYNLMQTDIYPYSIHYNLLIHPKNYDLTIPEIMKHNQKWIKEERLIFQSLIKSIIDNHQNRYLVARKAYDLQLAKYIKTNYELFAQKRWKYIIQYNKLQRSFETIKRQNQLRRLMRLIGSQSIIDQDCIPQKHVILQQALKRSDAPKTPKRYIRFSSYQFKKQFKIYFDNVSNRIKEFRNNC